MPAGEYQLRSVPMTDQPKPDGGAHEEERAPISRGRFRCPACGTVLPPALLRGSHSFACPSCNTSLQVSPWYSRVFTLVAFAGTLWLAYVLGARDWAFVLVAAVIFVPMVAFVAFVAFFLVPRELTFSGDWKSVTRSQ